MYAGSILLFNKYLVSIYYVSAIILGIVIKQAEIPILMEIMLTEETILLF